MISDLKQKTIVGIFWSAVERFGIQGIQFIFGLILARILSPSDFGLVGMLAIFIALAQSLIDSGFTTALIRKTNANTNDYSTVFWYNLFVSVILYIVIFFCAKPIANFYKQPELNLLAKIVTLTFIINAFGGIHRTILTKEFNFKTQAKVAVWSVLIGGIAGIYFAYTGWGVWSLVIQTLVRTFLNNILLWTVAKWKPIVVFSKKSFKEMFSFGYKLMLSGILNTIFENLYTLIIGKLFSAQTLGYYTRADQFQKLPVSGIYGVMQKVTFPVLSQLQNDDEKLRSAYRKFIRMNCFIVFPVMTILGCIAHPMIKVLLTDKWLPTTPLLQIFCIYGALYPLHAINLNILTVKGRSDLFLKLEVIKKILVVLTIICSIPFGVKGLVVGQVILSVLALYLNLFYTNKLIQYSIKDQLIDIMPHIFISLFIGISISAFIFIISSALIQFLGGIVVSILISLIVFYFINIEEKKEIISVFLKFKLRITK